MSVSRRKDVKMTGFAECLRVDEAWKRFSEVAGIEVLEFEEVPIADGLERVLARDVVSGIDVPHFDRAAVDGYAVRSEVTLGASTSNPVVLDLVGVLEAGKPLELRVGKLQAVRVSTGSAMPKGADSVVMLEYTDVIDEKRIEVYTSTTPYDNVSRVGEDVGKGEKILRKGTILQPQDIAMLSALGLDKVEVVRKPKVAVLSTGSELVEPAGKIEPGKTFDVNRYFLLSAIKQVGGIPVDLGIEADDVEKIKSKVLAALELVDLLLVSGGSSVGMKDFVPDAVESIEGSSIIVHGVCMRPGKPTALGVIMKKPVVLLPGYPVASMIAFHVFVQRIIGRMLGIPLPDIGGRMVRARMARRTPSVPGVRDFVRVTVRKEKSGYVAEPIRITGSGIVSSMVKASGIVVIPEESEGIEEGELVDVILLRPWERVAV